MSDEIVTENSASTAGAPNNQEEGIKPPQATANHNEHSTSFECNICLDTAKDAVISFCGHLFCWPCLHQWLETRPIRQVCPVCKSAIGKDKVVPLYGRNGDNKDPRNSVPPRPPGQRSEPTATNLTSLNFGGLGLEGGFQFSFGIGMFPFTIIANAFHLGGDLRPPAPTPGTAQYEAERGLNFLFVFVAVLFSFWLMLV